MSLKASLQKLTGLFAPKSIVLVGASANPLSLGFTVARSLIRQFKGPVYYLNPTEAKVLGSSTYADIRDVPQGQHLWIFATVTKDFPVFLRQVCEQNPAAILLLTEIPAHIISETTKTLSSFKCPVIGPRSAGYLDTTTMIDAITLPNEMLQRPPSGATGVLTDNRDVAFGLLELLSKYRCGVSRVIDLGDSIGTDESAVMSFFANDSSTRVIILASGQIARLRTFKSAVRRAQRAKKPVIVPQFSPEIIDMLGLHRRSDAGASHITRALVEQLKLIETTSWGRAVDLAKLCQWQPLPKGPGIAVISNFGPYCVNAASSLQYSKMKVAHLATQTLRQLQETLPPYCRAANPTCLYTNADEIRLDTALQIIFPDTSVHTVMLCLLPNSPFIDPDYLGIMLRQRLARVETTKTIIGIIPAIEPDNLLIQALEQLQIPVYSNPHRAVSTLETAYRYTSSLSQTRSK
ncbi:MAG: CoA-binding protein [Promethearchaeota archaeon]